MAKSKTTKLTEVQREAAMRAEARSASFRIACVEYAAQAIGTLTADSRIIGLTKGQFSMLDLMRAVLAQTGPADVILSTWTFGIRDIENAKWLLETGEIRSLRLLTDRSFATRQPRYCRRLVEVFGESCIRASMTHAKFFVVRNTEWAVCVRGSMNLNRNARWENFDLDGSAPICDFFEALVAELERLTPPGPSPALPAEGDEEGDPVVRDVFARALEGATCGDVRLSELTAAGKLARLAYSDAEIRERLFEERDEVDVARDALEDQYREAVITAANGGDVKAQEVVGAWLVRARCRN